MGILINHPKLKKIINKLDFSIINPSVSKGKNYSSANHSGYLRDTIFEGVYLNKKDWISVNIIEGYDDLFIHTTLKPKSNNLLNNYIENNLRGFNIRTTSLFRVGKISNRVDDLVDIIHKDILPNIN